MEGNTARTDRARAAITSLLAVFALGTGCSSNNAAFCDQSTPCKDSARPFCHVDQNRCSDVPVGDPCDTATDCTNPDTSICYHGACVACTTDDDCGAAAPVCDPSSLTCTSCAGDGMAATCQRFDGAPFCLAGGCSECGTGADCPADRPVCDPDMLACRACTAGADCDSNVCDADLGTCIDAPAVLYVEKDGSDKGTCTQDAPCATVGRAVDLATLDRFWVHVGKGSYAEAVTIDKNLSVTGSEATLAGTAGQPVVTVSGGASVRLNSLTIHGPSVGITCDGSSLEVTGALVTGNSQDGIDASSCDVKITGSELSHNQGTGLNLSTGGSGRLTDTKITNNLDSGVYVTGGTIEFLVEQSSIASNDGNGIHSTGQLTITATSLSGNTGIGVQTAAGSLDLEACTIKANYEGGVFASNTAVQLINNFVVENGHLPQGGAPGGDGGIYLGTGSSGTVEHNTIVSNNALSSLGAGGIICTPSLALKNNLLATNHFNLVSPEAQVAGNCTHTFTLAFPKAPSGTGNLEVEPVFVGPGDYHLSTSSPGIDSAKVSDVLTDIDGDSRPQGPGPDIGADEVVK